MTTNFEDLTTKLIEFRDGECTAYEVVVEIEALIQERIDMFEKQLRQEGSLR